MYGMCNYVINTFVLAGSTTQIYNAIPSQQYNRNVTIQDHPSTIMCSYGLYEYVVQWEHL